MPARPARPDLTDADKLRIKRHLDEGLAAARAVQARTVAEATAGAVEPG